MPLPALHAERPDPRCPGNCASQPLGFDFGYAFQPIVDVAARSVWGHEALVRGSAEMVAQATAQIAAGNQDLSSRTEAQASSLEQTAAALEELRSSAVFFKLVGSYPRVD